MALNHGVDKAPVAEVFGDMLKVAREIGSLVLATAEIVAAELAYKFISGGQNMPEQPTPPKIRMKDN